MRKSLAFGLAMVCALGGTASFAARASDPGVSANALEIGGVIDQTGRGTVISKPILGGYDLAIKQINSQGGVNGRAIHYTALSDNYDPSQTLPQIKQLVENDHVFAVLGVFGSDDTNAVLPYLQQRAVPLFDPIGGGANIAGDGWVWQTEPDYGREGRAITSFLGTHLKAKKIGILYQVGVGEPQVAAIKAASKHYGARVVGIASYQATDSNLSGQVMKLRGANPDVIVLNGTPTPTAAFLQYARLLGYKPKDGYLANYPMGDPLWLALVGSNGEGNYISSYADLTGKNSVASRYRSAIAQYHGEAYSNYGLYGYFNAMLFFQALKKAGTAPTRAGLQKVLDTKYRHYSTGFTGKLNWTPKQHYGARQFKIYRIHNGTFVPVTGWITP